MAKKSLAVASYNHYKRVKWAKSSSQTTQPKAKLGENLFAGKMRNKWTFIYEKLPLRIPCVRSVWCAENVGFSGG